MLISNPFIFLSMKKWIPISIGCIFLVTVGYLYAEYDYENRTYVIPMRESILVPDVSDVHYEPIYSERFWLSMERITPLNDGSIRIDFSQNGWTDTSVIPLIPEFEHSENIKINQMFAVMCLPLKEEDHKMLCDDTDDQDARACTTPLTGGTPSVVNFLQYLGMTPDRNGVLSYKFFHVSADLQEYMPCDYPKVIRNSVDVRTLYYDPDIIYPNDVEWHNRTEEQRQQLHDQIDAINSAQTP